LRLSVVCPGSRASGLSAARDALSDAGFSVTDAQLYSDLAACLTFEGAGEGLVALSQALETSGLRLDEESRLRLAGASRRMDLQGTLALTFATGTGDLRHEKPAVPG
jgi:hypothetical protein